MDRNLKLETTIELNASISKVWQGLTDPKYVKQYFYGTNLECNWKKGCPILFKGEWEGKPYEEKGEIIEIEEGKSATYSYLSTGFEDTPDNYAIITYRLIPDGDKTLLIIIQEGFKNRQACDHSAEGWKTVLNGLKVLLEKESSFL
jgi:uncharacterized protein YndB with AHSA1/START domain